MCINLPSSTTVLQQSTSPSCFDRSTRTLIFMDNAILSPPMESNVGKLLRTITACCPAFSWRSSSCAWAPIQGRNNVNCCHVFVVLLLLLFYCCCYRCDVAVSTKHNENLPDLCAPPCSLHTSTGETLASVIIGERTKK